MREWSARNREVMNARCHRYYRQNHEKCLDMMRRYRENHKEESRIYQLAYRLKNKEKRSAAAKLWKKNNKSSVRASNWKRKAIKRSATVKDLVVIRNFIQSFKTKKKIRCYYCGNSINGTFHIDHVKALALGGEHSIDNICVSCQECNLTKSVRPIGEWQPKIQLILSL